MNCEEAIRLIHLNAEDELSAAERNDLQGHLHICDRCPAEAQLVRQTDRLLKNLRASTPILARPEDLAESILDSVARDPRPDSDHPRKHALDSLLNVFLRPAIRYAYAALVLFFVALFMVQQADTLRSMEALSAKLSRSHGSLEADIRYGISVDDAQKIVGKAELEPLIAGAPVRISHDRLSVRRSDIEPWTPSFSSRLVTRMFASSETPSERLPDLLLDLQRSISSSFILRIGGDNQ